jgi:hypothetical protein
MTPRGYIDSQARPAVLAGHARPDAIEEVADGTVGSAELAGFTWQSCERDRASAVARMSRHVTIHLEVEAIPEGWRWRSERRTPGGPSGIELGCAATGEEAAHRAASAAHRWRPGGEG